MNKIVPVILIALGFIAFSGAEKGSDSKSSSKSDIEIIYLNVLSTVQARFATTLITSHVSNRGDTAKEISFTAQLPDAAFISNFSMQIGDKIIYGKVDEKEKAKADFDAAKARGESTGLVAKAPRETNSFTISVNVAAYSKVKFNLTYQEILKRVHGVYKQIINLQPDQPVSELKVDVYITEKGDITNVKVPKFGEKAGEKTNKELLTLPSEPNVEIKTIIKEAGISSVHIHYQPKQKTKTEVYNGQLVVLYDVKRDKTAGDIEVVDGYFVHFFAPEGLPKRAKNIIFVLDKSGSMQGRKMAQLKDAMKVILNDLNSDDLFQIIFFSDSTEKWRSEFSKATEDNVKAAVQYVMDTEADGGTNIYDSLQEAVKVLKKSTSKNVPMILFLTDGQATVGETSTPKIVDDTTSANDQERKIIIHSVAFGDDGDYNILQKISSRNRGLARKVYEDSDAAIQLAGFYEEISSPLLTDLKIDYLNETVDATTVVQDNTHNYYDGSEVVVLGKVKPTKKNVVESTVHGSGDAGTVSLRCISPPIIRCPIIDYDYYSPCFGCVPPPIWCCPPPHCCWRWGGCPPPPPRPTEAPKPLPANTVGGFVERMWAYQTIKKLLKENEIKDGDSAAKQKALQLSLKYNFVTELTSMVVVKPGESKETSLEKEDSSSKKPGGGSVASSGGAPGRFAARPQSGGFGGGAVGPFGPPPPPPPTAGKTEESASTSDKDNNNNVAQQRGCNIEIIFVKNNTNFTASGDQKRNDFMTQVASKLRPSNGHIKVAVVSALSDGHAVASQPMISIDTASFGQVGGSTKSSTTLAQTVNAQFGQYTKSNVKRYVVFLITSSSQIQPAQNAATSFQSHGVTIYAVSFTGDGSSGFVKGLNSLTQDPARVLNVPSSTGSDLAQAVGKC